jgi:23S rRNA (pseudouridine1915-N3)-methyltransferase
MLTIIAIGKLKEPYAREACEEYLKRLSPYLKINVVEIPETPFKDTNDREKIQNTEAEKILRHIKKDTHIIALHPNAKPQTSEEFSKKLTQWQQKSDVVFIIGGPLGLAPEFLAQTQEKLSLSPLTFTHQMTRVILLEQLYRGIMITKNKYHY